MHETHLRAIDLNLLVPLDLLLEHRSVTAAARVANMSQPAMSRALGRLRALLRDPLLARGKDGFVLTPRGEALRPAVRQMLADVRRLIAADAFDPAQWAGEIVVAASDQQTLQLLPGLMAHLSRAAPRLDVQVVPIGPETRGDLLAGRIDLAFGLAEERQPAGVNYHPLYDDHFVTLLRQDHPAASDWSLATFLALDHVLVTVLRDGRGALDEALARSGRTRRVALRLPHFYAAMTVVATSDMVVTLPNSLARAHAAGLGLTILPTPVERAPFRIGMIWPAARDADPASRWLRATVLQSVAATAALAPFVVAKS